MILSSQYFSQIFVHTIQIQLPHHFIRTYRRYTYICIFWMEHRGKIIKAVPLTAFYCSQYFLFSLFFRNGRVPIWVWHLSIKLKHVPEILCMSNSTWETYHLKGTTTKYRLYILSLNLIFEVFILFICQCFYQYTYINAFSLIFA